MEITERSCQLLWKQQREQVCYYGNNRKDMLVTIETAEWKSVYSIAHVLCRTGHVAMATTVL